MDHAHLAAAVEEARMAVAAGDCQRHSGPIPQPVLTCSGCAGDHKADGDGDWLQRNATLRAMAACDRSFPKRYRDATVCNPAVAAWVDAVVADPGSDRSLLLVGPVGRGKTWLAYAALRAVLADLPGLDWAAASFADFTASLRPRPGLDAEAEMDRYRNAGVLLLDDIGVAKGSEWVEEITYRIVNHRYDAMLPTIYASNLAAGELRETVGDRIASRLAETCDRVLVDGPDRRRTTDPEGQPR